MNRTGFLVVALCAVAVSCGGSSGDDAATAKTDGTSTTTATVSPATEPSTTTEAYTTAELTTTTEAPTTTVDPLVSSQTAYFYISSETNGRQHELDDRYYGSDGTMNWDQLPVYCAAQAVISEDFIKGIQDAQWIPEAQDEIDELIAANVAVLTYTYQCSNSAGTSDVQAAIETSSASALQRADEAASATRFALGLPIDRD